jgi:hypothetical protein
VADGLASTQPVPRAGVSRGRLIAAGVVIVAVVAGALAALLLLVGQKKPWSDWKPRASSDPNAVVHEITHHVAPRYHLANGVALAGSLGASRLLLGNEQITAIVRDPGTTGQTLVAQPTPTDTVEITFCGSGPICSLPANSLRAQAAARAEALEIALYALKYVPALNTVVVTMPPNQGEATDHALVVTRGDAASALKRPLADSVGWKQPPAVDKIDAALATKIGTAIGAHVYRYETGTDPTGRYAMAIYSG